MIRLFGSFSRILCSTSLLRQPYVLTNNADDNHRVTSIQHNDNHVAAIDHLLQLMKEGSVGLDGRIVLLRMLFALRMTCTARSIQAHRAEPLAPRQTSAAETGHSEP